ncbi:MAG TPA: endopeptidase La [Nitrospirota bacterium]|nr:endopeptidase La [Nitrospirota bacterium]
MKLFGKDRENEEKESIIDELQQKIQTAHLPPPVEKIALQELENISRINPSAAEHAVGVTYIDYLVSLPWNKKTDDNLDLARAERILDENHYGLGSIKERVLEHLAVKVLMLRKKYRLLIVDDEEIARKNLSHVLTKEDYDVTAVSNGEGALAELEKSEFDVVLTDLRMGSIDGMDLLLKIRTRYPDTRVIMITGFATIPSAIEAMQKGAYHYIPKPFKLDEVRAVIKQAVNARGSGVSTKGSVLCFAGPPGTGKTSLGRSIAQALGRKFTRIALGGLKDEADIRGHRRTYVGAKPGRLIDELRRVESSNPVIVLDEIDKIGRDVKGDPESALLEVLDAEQNRAFTDHYLDVPFDLSNIMFIVTANMLDSIPMPLRDRMEVIEFTGYTEQDKVHIARHLLCPKQIRDKGLTPEQIVFTDEGIVKIIQEYTREAGIRELERKIATVCRKVAKACVECSSLGLINITPSLVEKYLGKKTYCFDVIEEQDRIGVATGLVRTETGGDIIFVEAARMKGSKQLIITGSLGDVMRESAQTALSYIRSNASRFGIPEDFFESQDIHIHVPSGAVQKDGPSAGITILAALASLLTKRPARRDIALTGEITLAGRLLPVGGVREKILAARRANVKTVMLPLRNRDHVDELDDDVKQGVEIRLADSVMDVVNAVLT